MNSTKGSPYGTNKKTARDASYFQTSGAIIHALNHWTSVLENFPYSLGALIFNFILYQSELIPRWLSVWGLVAATLLLAMGFLRLFGYFGQSAVFLAIPIILNELVLAVWLISKGIDSYANASAIVGVLIITALASSMLSGSFLGSINKPDYLTAVSANEKKVVTGVLLMVVLTVSVVSIPIVIFPILSVYSESLALGYVGARIFEGISDAVIALSHLLQLTLSREYVTAETPNVETDSSEIN